MRRSLTVVMLIGFILGVGLGPIFIWHSSLVALWLIGGLTGLALIYHRSRWLTIACCLTAVVALGNLRFSLGDSATKPLPSGLASTTVKLSGVIIDDPQVSSDRASFTLRVRAVNDQSVVIRKVLITVPTYTDYEYGNLLTVTGQLLPPINRGQFDYGGYLKRFGISATMSYPEIVVDKNFVGNPLLAKLYFIKHRLISAAERALVEPPAALLVGLLFGSRSNLPTPLLDSFSSVGLTHIIALSGFNITIIATSLLWLLAWLPLRWRYLTAMLVIGLFVLMTGASPSVTRAAIMGGLVLWAALTGRLADSGIALLFTAVIMLMANPLVLYHDVGFQLSFMATVGIIYLSPIMSAVFERLPKTLNSYLSPTLAAIVFSTPLLVYHFARLSLIAPVANLLVLPLIPLAMGLGFLVVVITLINPVLGSWLGLAAVLPLNWIVAVTTLLARLPAASISVNLSSAWWVVLAYAILGLGLMIKQHRASHIAYRLAPLSATR